MGMRLFFMERIKVGHLENNKKIEPNKKPENSFSKRWEQYVNEKKEDIVIKGPKPSTWEY